MEDVMLRFERLKDRMQGENLREIAEATGLHYNTVYRFLNHEKDPKYSTMKVIDDYFRSE